MDQQFLSLLIMFPIFFFSLTIHEVAHALTANWGGDMTATYQNRLSLNPLNHIDPVGTILIPILAIYSGIPFFGWAKPVPVDQSRFRDRAWDVVVSLAGPFSNLLQVIFGSLLFSFAVRLLIAGQSHGLWQLSHALLTNIHLFAVYFVLLNWVLCLFNLFPVPPLDGSHVFYHFFIRGRGFLYPAWEIYRRAGFVVLFFLFWLTPFGQVFSRADELATASMRLLGYPL